jgi:GNAT superfamily N-acetyltransferase
VSGLRIGFLADHLRLSRVVGGWHWDEWGEDDPGGSAESWSDSLAQRAGRGEVPTVWLAFHEDVPAGSVVLTGHDMETRPNNSPWLAGLYVLPAFRGKGIGQRLVQTCEGAAQALGHPTLYLHTEIPGFYSRLGWVVLARELYLGTSVVVMTRDLS